MVVSYLKHSYLNWRAIPCKRRMVCVYAFFIIFFQFTIGLKWISPVHDMTINFLFLLFIHFFFFFGLPTLGNVACRRWPSSLKYLFSYEDRFEKVGFWLEVARIISVQRKNMTQKYSRKMGNFWSMCPKASI